MYRDIIIEIIFHSSSTIYELKELANDIDYQLQVIIIVP